MPPSMAMRAALATLQIIARGRRAFAVLGYMTKMGVSSSVVEAMSETREIRWLAPKDALAMNLITDPLGKP